MAADSASGWFHVIWGDGVRYVLVTGADRSIELLLAPAVMDSIGDPLLLDRRRVTVVGSMVPEDGRRMRVTALRAHSPEN